MTSQSIRYKEGFRFYLAEDFQIHVEGLPEVSVSEVYKMALSAGNLRISRGYMWDGFWRNKKFIRGFLVHEAMCHLIRLGYLSYDWKARANSVLYELLVEDGIPQCFALGIKKFLDIFGRISSNGGRKVMTAP